MVDEHVRDGQLVINPSDDGHAVTNADLRCEIATEVGFDLQHRLPNDDDTRGGHATYFHLAELAAILNHVRFQQDQHPEPVAWTHSKMDVVEELGARCGYRARRPRLERVELEAVHEEVTT